MRCKKLSQLWTPGSWRGPMTYIAGSRGCAAALRSISMQQIVEWCQAEGLELVELAPAPLNGSPTLVCRKP